MKAVTPSGCVITEPFQLQDWNFFPEICHTAWHNLRLVLQSKSDPKYYPQRANVCWAHEIFCDIYDKNATFCDKTLFCILASKEEYIYISIRSDITKEIYNYTKFCIGLKIRKSRCRTTLTLRFGSLKMIFECSIARCDVGLGRAIVQCQKNPLRKPKLSINRAILSAHFSAVKFCIGFFCWIGFFLVLHRLFL